MEEDLVDIFTTTLREMDVIYLEWLAKERERLTKMPPPKSGKGAARKR